MGPAIKREKKKADLTHAPPPPSQGFFTHPALSEMHHALMGMQRTRAKRWWPASDCGQCFWRCAYPHRFIQIQ